MLPSSTKDISGEIQSVKACDTRVCHGTVCVFKIAGWGEKNNYIPRWSQTTSCWFLLAFFVLGNTTQGSDR